MLSSLAGVGELDAKREKQFHVSACGVPGAWGEQGQAMVLEIGQLCWLAQAPCGVDEALGQLKIFAVAGGDQKHIACVCFAYAQNFHHEGSILPDVCAFRAWLRLPSQSCRFLLSP